jgi:hypothetical protein
VAKHTEPAAQSADVQQGCVQKLALPAAEYRPGVTLSWSPHTSLVQAAAPLQAHPTPPGQGPDASGEPVSTMVPVSGGGGALSGMELSTVPVSTTDTSSPMPESTATHIPDWKSHVPLLPQLVAEHRGWHWWDTGLQT